MLAVFKFQLATDDYGSINEDDTNDDNNYEIVNGFESTQKEEDNTVALLMQENEREANC